VSCRLKSGGCWRATFIGGSNQKDFWLVVGGNFWVRGGGGGGGGGGLNGGGQQLTGGEQRGGVGRICIWYLNLLMDSSIKKGDDRSSGSSSNLTFRQEVKFGLKLWNGDIVKNVDGDRRKKMGIRGHHPVEKRKT